MRQIPVAVLVVEMIPPDITVPILSHFDRLVLSILHARRTRSVSGRKMASNIRKMARRGGADKYGNRNNFGVPYTSETARYHYSFRSDDGVEYYTYDEVYDFLKEDLYPFRLYLRGCNSKKGRNKLDKFRATAARFTYDASTDSPECEV